MRRIMPAVAVCVFALSVGAYADAPEPEDVANVSGFVLSRDGITTNFTRLDPRAKVFSFKYGPEDKETTIPAAKVREITFGDGSDSAVFALRDGRTVMARRLTRTGYGPHWSDKGGAFFKYAYFDDVAGAERDASPAFKDLARIVFGEHVGRFRVCPHCKALWPDTYLFCPHDGTRIIWGEPSRPVPDRQEKDDASGDEADDD